MRCDVIAQGIVNAAKEVRFLMALACKSEPAPEYWHLSASALWGPSNYAEALIVWKCL